MAIGIGGLVVGGWPIVVALQGPQPILLPAVLAHVTGMLAGYGLVVMLGLMAREPGIERGSAPTCWLAGTLGAAGS